MKCPGCETSDLEVRTRDGVEIDVCPRCRGVWLDRGELEKLIARAVKDDDEDRDHDEDGDDDDELSTRTTKFRKPMFLRSMQF